MSGGSSGIEVPLGVLRLDRVPGVSVVERFAGGVLECGVDLLGREPVCGGGGAGCPRASRVVVGDTGLTANGSVVCWRAISLGWSG